MHLYINLDIHCLDLRTYMNLPMFVCILDMFPTGHRGMFAATLAHWEPLSQVEESKEAETKCEPKKAQEVKQATELERLKT